MPQPVVTVVPNPAHLLEHAAAHLFPIEAATVEHPWPGLRAWVVLRQGGLRDDFYSLAAARGVVGWFGTPICLFSDLVRNWSVAHGSKPLSVPERLTITSRLLEQFGDGVFGAASTREAWAPALDRLIGELISEGVSPDSFREALTTAADDDFSRRRGAAVAQIYAEWERTLERVGRADGRDALVRLAAEIAANPSAFSQRLGGVREIRFVGLADLSGGWRQLIAALAATPALDRLEIITSSRLEFPPSIPVAYQADPAAVGTEDAFFSDVAFAQSSVHLLEAPDSAREVEAIALRVRALVDQGVVPAAIAVVSRQARPHVNAMVTALSKLGIPVTARQRIAISHTGPARALRALLGTAAQSWARHAVLEMADNPLLDSGLDAGVLNHVGFSRPMASLDDWTHGLEELLARCEARERGEDEDEHPRPLPPRDTVSRTRDAWARLRDHLAGLDTPRPLRDWFLWTVETLRDETWAIEAAVQAPLASQATWCDDVRAVDRIAELATDWATALDQLGGDSGPTNAAAFAQHLAALLGADLDHHPETEFGVTVSEARAVAWRSFHHIFLIGLSAGTFPLRSRPATVLDAHDRQALIDAGLRLESPDAWRAREAELFRVLCAGATRSLTLSWPAMDEGATEVARSAFVDEIAAAVVRARGLRADDDDAALEVAGVLVRIPTQDMLVKDFPVALERPAIARALIVGQREQARTQQPSPWNGRIEDPDLVRWLRTRYGEDFVWSATQLEQLAKCPWHWFAQRQLQLEAQAEPDDIMEPTVRGSLLHAALDRFFSAAREQQGGPAYLRDDDREWAVPLMDASLELVWGAAAAAGEWLGPALFRPLALAELKADLRRYLNFEIQWNEASFSSRHTTARGQVRTGAAEGELRFDRVPVAVGDTRILLRGAIDRVDRGCDERVPDAERYVAAIDYKTSESSTPAAGKRGGWQDGVVLQIPLYAAVIRATRPDVELARIEYRTIRKPQQVHMLSFASLKDGALQSADAAEAQLAGALDAAGRHVQAARSGVLPAAPAPSCGCPPYCPARDVCRIPGGPVEPAR